MVNTNTLAGTYSNQIVYTALASATAIDQVSTNMVELQELLMAKPH